jgi:hypothetical protein
MYSVVFCYNVDINIAANVVDLDQCGTTVQFLFDGDDMLDIEKDSRCNVP